jgi:4-amino-4-deoxy-L-arabinose transferase-like glycosyltransferase
MKKIEKILKSNKILILILIIGFFLRVFKVRELFMYGHDQDLAGWFVKDIIENRHLRLIGQETSTQGIFIGPIYYYLLIPFYLISGMDPIGGVAMITVLGMFSIWSFYYVFKKVFTEREGLIAAFIYAVSFYTIFNDREVAPTMPVLVWTVWYFYGLNLLLKGKQKKGFLIAGILIGLIWHLNMALVLLLPLIPLSILLSKKKIQPRQLLHGLFAILLLSLPLALFEMRHDFSQVKAFILSLTTDQHAIVSGYEQFLRTIHLLSKNADGLIWGSIQPVSYETTTFLLLALFSYLVYKKIIKKHLAIIFSGWLILYIGFFSIYSKNLSEYYLNGTILLWISVLTLGISCLFSQQKSKKYGVGILVIFSVLNLIRFFNIEINQSGYLERKAVVAEIRQNAENQDYPCVAISYITKPGYDLGYRYLFWLEKLHVNRPKSESPVYTIVYPLRQDIEVDKTFGAIGLIYPDYSRYTKEGIEESCSGENQNLTEPMYGMP